MSFFSVLLLLPFYFRCLFLFLPFHFRCLFSAFLFFCSQCRGLWMAFTSKFTGAFTSTQKRQAEPIYAGTTDILPTSLTFGLAFFGGWSSKRSAPFPFFLVVLVCCFEGQVSSW